MDNFNTLRQTAKASGVREQVRVNQRHLVDKILARYAGENVVWRELIQNSDDAGATEVEIEFRTSKENVLVVEAVYRNNGMAFREEDWKRLKSIAEGNPDESKIGFFGVGFYAVFSISEEPMVVSGPSCLLFGWDQDSLFCHKAAAEPDKEGWTSFILPSRETYPTAKIDDIGKFAANCLTFARNVSAIRILYDEKTVVAVHRTKGDASDLRQTVSPYIARSPNRVFSLVGASRMTFDVNAVLEDRKDVRSALHFTTTAKVQVTKKFAEQMERVTKKKPPQVIQISLVVGEAVSNPQVRDEGNKASVTAEIVPTLGAGRIFIGFATHQTTGAAVHVSAPLVPTVERESIDFVQPTLTAWNTEILLFAGSFLRATYESSMADLGSQFMGEKEQAEKVKTVEIPESEPKPVAKDEEVKQKKSVFGSLFSGLRTLVTESIGVDLTRWSEEDELRAELEKLMPSERAAVSVMRAHTFVPSTPDKRVGQKVLEGFLGGKQAVSVITSVGARPANVARIDTEGMDQFVQHSPMVKKTVARSCFQLLELLTQQNGLKALTLDELIADIEKQTMDPAQFLNLMRWWARYRLRHAHEEPRGVRLKRAIIVADESGPVAIGSFQYVSPPRLGIPDSLPLPGDVLPRSLSAEVMKIWREAKDIAWFTELDFGKWLKFAAEQILAKPEKESMYARVLQTCNDRYNNLSNRDQLVLAEQLRSHLKGLACVETSKGIKVPGESYLSSVKLFDDLPFVTSNSLGKSFLVAIGVREHVEPGLVFARLDSLQWNFMALLRYLCTVQEHFSPEEWQKLRATSFLPLRRSAADAPMVHVKGSELFAPSSELFELGLPTLEWDDSKPYKAGSAESRFLELIGVRPHPTASDVIQRAQNLGLSQKAEAARLLQYLARHVGDYFSGDYPSLKDRSRFLPAKLAGNDTMETPARCFLDESAAVLGFPVLDAMLKDAGPKLGVRAQPSADEIMNRVEAVFQREKPVPIDPVYDYLRLQSGSFKSEHWKLLERSLLIPAQLAPESPSISWLKTSEVYFANESTEGSARRQAHAALFYFVDFGPALNAFLRNCGVRDEPSQAEIMQKIVTDPQGVFNKIGREDNYAALLREVALNFEQLPQTLKRDMRRKEFLLGFRDDAAPRLSKAADCSLVDHTILRQMFNPLSAPLESVLEQFYERLGAKWLSQEVQRRFEVQNEKAETEGTRALRDTILQRAPLLIMESGGKQSRMLKAGAGKLLTKEKLSVKEVESISCVLTFRGVVRRQHVTACARGSLEILVERNFDMFDVSSAVGDRIFERNRLEDSLLLATILETSLGALKSRGFPVDRLKIEVQSPVANARNSVPAKVPNNAPNAAEAARGTSTTSAGATGMEPSVRAAVPSGARHGEFPNDSPIQHKSTNNSVDKQPVEQSGEGDRLEGFVDILRAMFPDADEGFIRKLLRDNKHKGDDALTHARDVLSRGEYPRKGENGSTKDQGAATSEKSRPQQRKSGSRGLGGMTSKLMKKVGIQSAIESGVNQMAKGMGPTGMGATAGRSAPAGAQVPSTTPSPNDRRQGPVPQPGALEKVLKDATALSRPQSDNSINAQPTIMKRAPPSMESSCEIIPGADLVVVKPPQQFSRGGLRLYRTRGVDMEQLEPLWGQYLEFSQLLSELGGRVFSVRQAALCVFYDPGSTKIAFNSSNNHAIHFNLDYYAILRHSSDLSSRRPATYWFFVFCHELAHNIVAEHNEVHEFYFQSYAETYFEPFLKYLAETGRM